MRRICLVLALALFPVGAQAQGYCIEAWVIRNMIFDRLGHCFSSVAGQMLFDNSNCTVSGPTPFGEDRETVAFIREGEAHVGCRINTSQPPSAAMRATYARFYRFIDLPAPDYVGGYACWGYRGPAFTLHAGASLAAPVVGVAQTGQSVLSTYYGRPGGWNFVEILTGPDGAKLAEGWMAGVDLSPGNCEMVAG